MKLFFSYIIIVIFLVSSCNKEEPKEPIYAGIYDTDFFFQEFNPPFQIDLKFDSLLNIKYGVDSIDLNVDGNFDLFVSQRILLDYDNSSNIVWDNFPYCRLKLKNGLEVSTLTQCYPAGHGYYDSVDWVDTLNYNYEIDTNIDWSETNTSRSMWAVPPSSLVRSFGCWFKVVNSEKYIAIRMKIGSHYKYGWIKVNQISHEKFLIVSYAIEK